MQYRRVLYHVLYGSIYMVLLFVLVGLLLITPADAIQRSLRNGQKYNVLILTTLYVTTLVTLVFVYTLRLYINKTALAAIPKAWVPIDRGDVRDGVYRMIQRGLSRSAAIAYEARPREDMDVGGGLLAEEPGGQRGAQETMAQELGSPPPRRRQPVWGEIEHCGWASPYAADLRNLEYGSVVAELPNLVEARALTLLAPTHGGADAAAQTPVVVDADAAALLRRLPSMTMRDYLEHLAGVGVVSAGDDSSAALFLARYEHARFSNHPLSNARFRELMHLFAELLRGMQPLDVGALPSLDDDDDDDGKDASYGWGPSGSDLDIDNDAPLSTNPPSPQSTTSSSRTTLGSVRRRRRRRPHAQEAPSTPVSRRGATGAGYARGPLRTVTSRLSSASLRSRVTATTATTSSSSEPGSVIRLARGGDEGGMPYVLSLG